MTSLALRNQMAPNQWPIRSRGAGFILVNDKILSAGACLCCSRVTGRPVISRSIAIHKESYLSVGCLHRLNRCRTSMQPKDCRNHKWPEFFHFHALNFEHSRSIYPIHRRKGHACLPRSVKSIAPFNATLPVIPSLAMCGLPAKRTSTTAPHFSPLARRMVRINTLSLANADGALIKKSTLLTWHLYQGGRIKNLEPVAKFLGWYRFAQHVQKLFVAC